MKDRRPWLFVALMAGCAVLCVYYGVTRIGEGKLLPPEATCLLAMVFLVGAIYGNYFRNRVLHEALLALACVSGALGEWFHARESLFPTLLGLLAALCAWICWSRWKATRLRSHLSEPAGSAESER